MLVKDANGGTFQVQARLAAPVSASSYSVITEIGIQVGGDVVTIDATRSAPVWVDGQPIIFTGNTFGLADGQITKTATGYVVTLDTGESVTANFNPGGTQTGPVTTNAGGIYFSVSLGQNATYDSVEGLLGNYNGNPNDDLTLADGTVEPTNMSTATLYGVYANSWRVTQATSLLNYGPDQTTATFTDTNYPGTPISVSSFPASAVAAATQLVEQAGITDPGLQQAAIYDYLVTGDPSLISVEANLQQEGVTTVAQTDFVSPPPPPQVGIMASGTSEVEASPGPTTVPFEVYFTGDTSQPVTVDYTVVAPDGTYLGASDFGGALPSGTITLAAGQTSSALSISLPGGIGTAVSKTLEVEVSAAAPAVVIGATAQETIINGAPVAGVAPFFGVEFANDPGVLPTQSGTSWTFDLGALNQGEAFNPGTLSLAVLNLAGTGADDLAATVAASGDGGLPTAVSPSFADLAPGGLLDIANFAVTTTSLGAHSETFTFTPYDTNVSGYGAIMPAETVTVTDTIYPLAQALLSTNAIDFGAVRSGSVQQQAVGITNDGATGAEALDANIGAITGAGTGSGSFTLLPVGQTSSAIVVGLNTSAAGAVSGTVAIDPSSDGADTDGLGSTPLLPQIVTVSGAVYRGAAGQLRRRRRSSMSAIRARKSRRHQYQSRRRVLGRPARLAGVLLRRDLGGWQSDRAIVAGSSEIRRLTASFSTASAGTAQGSVTVDFQSDGTSTSAATLDSEPPPFPSRSPSTIMTGIDQGSEQRRNPSAKRQRLHPRFGRDRGRRGGADVRSRRPNSAVGPADMPSGYFSITGDSVFTNSGFDAFSGLTAGGAGDTAPTVSLATGTTGTFTETITLDPTGSNASGYSGALAPETLTVTAQVIVPVQLPSRSIEASSTSRTTPGPSHSRSVMRRWTFRSRRCFNGRNPKQSQRFRDYLYGDVHSDCRHYGHGCHGERDQRQLSRCVRRSPDSAGSTTSFTVDTVGPTLTPVANQTVLATGPSGTPATFAATATDPLDGTDPVVFTEGGNVVSSGETFGIGVNTITATATDANGNTASEQFTITVVSPPTPANNRSSRPRPPAILGRAIPSRSPSP